MSDPKFRSWSLADWPSDIYPNNADRARRVLRLYRRELMACGALARIGRELVVFGEAYNKWVRSKASRVDDFKVAANEARAAESGAP